MIIERNLSKEGTGNMRKVRCSERVGALINYSLNIVECLKWAVYQARGAPRECVVYLVG